MRYLVTATMAASVLAIGLKIDPAVSLSPGGKLTGADTAVHKVQRDKGGGPGGGGGPGAGSPGMGGGQQGGPAARAPGGGGGAMREGGGMRQGGGGMREGGAQFRSGERGMRGDGGGRSRAERGLRGDRGTEFGYRERGARGDRDRDRDRRRHGRRDGGFGLYFGPGYGYAPAGCEWLRRRALASDSAYWWRRYRACRGGY